MTLEPELRQALEVGRQIASQNRMSVMADKRADLDLQINLLSEQENTKMLVLLQAMADQFGVPVKQYAEVAFEARLEALSDSERALLGELPGVTKSSW